MPISFPSTVLFVASEPLSGWMVTPLLTLPEITLPEIVLSEAPMIPRPKFRLPSPRRDAPVMSVPMKLPCTRLLVAPSERSIPS